MKFQDDISNMNTYIHTYIHTDKPKPICPLLFQSWGHKKYEKIRNCSNQNPNPALKTKTRNNYMYNTTNSQTVNR